MAEWLQQRGVSARAYHADLQAEDRIAAEQQLLNNEVKALVATVALGMGFDKPDLGFVVHFQRPGSVVAYYQQVGRAGRAVDSAFGILLSGREDDEIQDYFIRTAFPSREVMEEILQELAGNEGMTVDEIGAALNYARSTLEKALKLLEVDGAVQQHQTKFSRTANRWSPDLLRAEQVTGHRRAELVEIQNYVEHTGCFMEFLSRALDDPAAAPCGKCMNCTGKTERRPAPPELIHAAAEFLRNDTLILEARHHWPKPVLKELEKAWPAMVARFETGKPKVTIPSHLCAEEGRVLCSYGDAGWGREVARGKYETRRFSDALVTAAADLIVAKWKPEPALRWVTAVPSQRHPTLVLDFAQRVAERLGLPLKPVLRKRRETRPQKEMQNSAMQLHNLIKAFEVVSPQPVPMPAEQRPNGFTSMVRRLSQEVASVIAQPPILDPGPVLLVDDVADSRWTLTLAAVLLRLHGSGPVFPFALARASLRGG